MNDFIKTYLDEVSQICTLIDEEEVAKVASEIIKVRESNGRIFFIGVGLSQIMLVLKKKQVEKVQAAEGI